MAKSAGTKVSWTPRAKAAFNESLAQARGRIMTVVRIAVRRHQAGALWHDGKKTLRGIRENVYELRYTHSCRVLVQPVGSELVVVDVGDHDVTRDYASVPPNRRAALLNLRTPVPEWFLTPHPVFDELEEAHVGGADDSTGWAAFLSADQSQAAERLVEEMVEALGGTEPRIAYIRGGAGTGKTAVMLNVALQLYDLGLSVEFRCSAALARYLRSHTHIDVRRLSRDRQAPDVVFVDDPRSPDAVQSAVAVATEYETAGVVVGFDPLQWPLKSVNVQLAALPRPDLDVVLTDCYRQSAGLAKQAISVISRVHERSSYRVDPARVKAERDVLEELSSQYLKGLAFTRPGGRLKVHDCTMVNLLAEGERLRSRKDLWKGLPALLELEDRNGGVSLTKAAKTARFGIKTQTEGLDEVDRYRGLDFQAVWIFLNRQFYERVQQGATGLSGPEWKRLLRLHIPLTRARDETVLFLVD